MHLLEYLKEASRVQNDASPSPDVDPTREEVDVEHRLVCSGVLYNRNVLTGDWTKSDVTRVLLREPVEFFAVGTFNDYPQELCVRLKISYVTKTEEFQGITSSTTFLPDDEIVADLCSILSLLARRLISVVGKIAERSREINSPLGSYGWNFPVSILRHSSFSVWRRRPATLTVDAKGEHVEFHDAPPTGVDDRALGAVLMKLPDLPKAAEVIHACRFYKTALELIETRPDIAYQLLISAVETMAGVALRDYKLSEAERLETQLGIRVLKKAEESGLDERQAKTIALAASWEAPSIRQRFRKFILDNFPADALSAEDRVFPWWSHLRPKPEHFEKALERIYQARSGNLHSGYPWPAWIGLGTSPTGDARTVPTFGLAPNDVPPVTWFERVVSGALRRFVLSQCSGKLEPFSSTYN